MTTAYVMFDLEDDRLREDAHPITLMNAIAAQGWQFLKKAIVCDDSPGEIYVPNTPETLANAWSNAKRAAPRYNGGYWMEFENYDELKLAFGLDPKAPRRLMLTIDTAQLRRREHAPNARAFVSVIELIYRTLHPAYGYGLFSYDVHTPNPPGARVQAIWDYNVFGPALVDQIGREKLGYLPVWRVVNFDDGGLLLELSPNPIAEAQAYMQFYRHAAQMLGLVYHQGAS